VDRALYLSRLEAEKNQAEWCGEEQRAAQLRSQILALSAGTAQPPARETAKRPAAARAGGRRGERTRR